MNTFTARYTSLRNGMRLLSAPYRFRALDFDDAVRCATIFRDGMRISAAADAIIELMAVQAEDYRGDVVKEGGDTIWDDPAK